MGVLTTWSQYYLPPHYSVSLLLATLLRACANLRVAVVPVARARRTCHAMVQGCCLRCMGSQAYYLTAHCVLFTLQRTEGHIVHDVDVVADDTRLSDDDTRRVVYRDPVAQAGACGK